MKKFFFLLSIFLMSASLGIAHEAPYATDKEILFAGSAAIIGTVVGTEGIHKDPDSLLRGVLKIRVDEIIGANKPELKVGQTISDIIIILDATSDAKTYGVKIPPEAAEVRYGGIRFEFKSEYLTEGELRTATVGKQFLFSLTTPSVPGGISTTVWPLWNSDWIRSCWTGGLCADRAPWYGPSGQEVLKCVAGVLSRQPSLSAVHATLAGYVKFNFIGRRNLPQSGLVWVFWGNGLHLLGAPMLDLEDAPVLNTAPILDENGVAIVGRNDDGNPLKAAIPAIADECHLPYAGDDAGRTKRI